MGGPCVALERGDLAQIPLTRTDLHGTLGPGSHGRGGPGTVPGRRRAGTGHPQVLFFPPHPEPLGDSLCGIVVFSSCSSLPPENLVGADLHFPLELVEPQEGIGGSCSDLQPEAGSGNVESRRDILSTEPDSSFCIQLTKTGVRPNSAYLLAKAAPDLEA